MKSIEEAGRGGSISKGPFYMAGNSGRTHHPAGPVQHPGGSSLKTYHSKFIFVEMTVLVDIAEIPDLQGLRHKKIQRTVKAFSTFLSAEQVPWIVASRT